MSLAFQQFKVYVRLGAVVAVTIAVATVLIMNRHNEVSVWFFWLTDESRKINVVWLMLTTGSATLLCARVLWVGRTLYGDMRRMKRAEDERKKQEDLLRREAAIAERERQAQIGTEPKTKEEPGKEA